MFKCIYSNRFQNQMFTKYNIKFPEEDYYCVDENAFSVADGVTRDLIGGEVRPYPKTEEEVRYIAEHYPNPSGAFLSSKIIADNFVKYIKSCNEISEQSIFDSIKKANADVWKINKDREIDYVGEDLYCSVAVGGIIQDEFLYCFGIGDCYIKTFDEDFNELFSTVNDHQWMEDYEERFLKKGMYSWADPRGRVLIRAGVRNNYILTFEGKKAGYGALTGEDAAMHFVKTYKVPLENVKYICAYTDGCMQYFENKEVSQKTIQNPDSIKDNGSERTLVIYTRN